MEGAGALRPNSRSNSRHFARRPDAPIKWLVVGPNDESGLKMPLVKYLKLYNLLPRIEIACMFHSRIFQTYFYISWVILDKFKT